MCAHVAVCSYIITDSLCHKRAHLSIIQNFTIGLTLKMKNFPRRRLWKGHKLSDLAHRTAVMTWACDIKRFFFCCDFSICDKTSEIFLFLWLFAKYFTPYSKFFYYLHFATHLNYFHHRWLLCESIILFSADDCKIIYFITLCMRNYFRHLRGWGREKFITLRIATMNIELSFYHHVEKIFEASIFDCYCWLFEVDL